MVDVVAATRSQIGWTGLATSLVLVVLAAVLSLTQSLRLERTIAWASIRALVQLLDLLLPAGLGRLRRVSGYSVW